MMYKLIRIIAIFLIVGSNAFSQAVLKPEQMKADLKILGELFIGLSPKIQDEDSVRILSTIGLAQEQLKDEALTPLQFFNFLLRVDFDTKFDEHASLSIAEDILGPLLSTGKIFPLPLTFLGEHVLVNVKDAEIPYGSKISSINGIPMDSILKDFTPDYQDTFVKRSLERQFSLIYFVKYGSSLKYEVEYLPNLTSDEKMTQVLEGIDFGSYREVFGNSVFPLKKEKLENVIHTEYIADHSTYYLQLNSFDWDRSVKKGLLHFLNSGHKNFEKRFDRIFDEIAEYQVENLIIDLRFNYGGNVKVPGILYSYIATDDFNESIEVRIKDFDLPHKDLIIKISSDDVKNGRDVEKFIKLYQKQFIREEDNTYVWRLVNNREVKPKSNAFDGNIFLLVSGRSISASAYFAALVKAYNRGLIYGEEMGGSYRSLSAGQILTYKLPNSKFELEAPIMEVNFSEQLYNILQVDKIIPDQQFSTDEEYKYFLQEADIHIEKIKMLVKEMDP